MFFSRFGLETIHKFKWDGNQKYGSNGAPESSNLYKQQVISKRSVKYFMVLVYAVVILCTFVNSQAWGIILSNHFPLHVASDKSVSGKV